MSKKFLVDVYLAKNLGDDMMLDHLTNSFPNIIFTPFYPGEEYKNFFKNYKNINPFKYSTYDKLLRRLKIKNKLNDFNSFARDYDGLIFLGGGIFREEDYWLDVYNYRKKIVETFNKNHKKIFWLGCNFGPFQSNKFKENYLNLFKESYDVCFRDIDSYNLFSILENVRYAPDILWDYPIPKVIKKEKQIGISIIDPSHKKGLEKYKAEYINIHKKIIKSFQKEDYSIILFSFCEKEGDLSIAESIKVGIENIEIVNYQGNIDFFLKKYGSCDFLITSRFHATILGFLYQIPTIPIIYNIKTQNMLKDINFNGISIGFDNLEKILSTNSKNINNSFSKSSYNNQCHFTELRKFTRDIRIKGVI